MTDTPKRQRGRPRLDKPPKVLRRPKAITPGKSADRVTIRLSDDMAAGLERYATAHGLPSLSAAVREIVHRGLIEE